MEEQKLECTAYGASSIGKVRKRNEDRFALLQDRKFFVVADGMGGRKGGDVAATSAVDFVCQKICSFIDQESSPLVVLKNLFSQTNQAILNLSKQSPELKGMGTTLTTMFLDRSKMFWGHIGDSRLYRIRKEKIEQITCDHVAHRLRKEPTKRYQSLSLTYTSRVLTQVMGVSPSVLPHIGSLDILEGDIFLLCTDGLTDRLSNKEILEIILNIPESQARCEALIELANQKGGNDNITLILVQINDGTDLPR